MNKKGDVWVSTVIYIAISITVLTIILLAALPLIDKLKDRNITVQTKNILMQIDKNVREVVSSGPGAKRVLSPVVIDAGILDFDRQNSVINWTLNTKDMFAEPGILKQEGSIFTIVYQRTVGGAKVEGEYIVSHYLDYRENPTIQIEFAQNSLRPPFTGRFTMTIKNIGPIQSGVVLIPRVEFDVQ